MFCSQFDTNMTPITWTTWLLQQITFPKQRGKLSIPLNLFQMMLFIRPLKTIHLSSSQSCILSWITTKKLLQENKVTSKCFTSHCYLDNIQKLSIWKCIFSIFGKIEFTLNRTKKNSNYWKKNNFPKKKKHDKKGKQWKPYT